MKFLTIMGTNLADTLSGQSDLSESFFGLQGADVIYAGPYDHAHGGAGNDILHGGMGSHLWGGAGDDTFVFKQSDFPCLCDVAHVRDFQHGHDKIDVSGFGIDWSAVVSGNVYHAYELTIKNVSKHMAAVAGDTNGDGNVDFVISVHTNKPLILDDVIL